MVVSWILTNINSIVGGFVGTCAFVFVFWGFKHGARLSARSLIRAIHIRRRDTANWVWRMWKSPAWREEVRRRETNSFRYIVLYLLIWYLFMKPLLSEIFIRPLSESEVSQGLIGPMLFAALSGVFGALVGAEFGNYLKLILLNRSYLRLMIRRERTDN